MNEKPNDGSKITPEAEDDLLSGYEPEVDDSPLDIKPPDRRLTTQPYDLSVRTLISQIDDKSLILHPPYQRGYVWDDGRASRLIESLLMNVPIPPCYFAEDQIGVSSVIDGHQRLYSIWRFRYGNFALQKLRTLTEYNGKKFEDLGEREKRLILGRTIRCIAITLESHPEIKFEVFERLNTGSVPLTDQEIRNAIFRGPFNEFIKRLADQPRWRDVLVKKSLDKRMRDDELVVRFLAFHERYQTYQAPLRTFLNSYTKDNLKILDSEQQRLTGVFEETVDKVREVFGEHAFRTKGPDGWERQINRALFDVVMLVFSQISRDELVAKKEQVNTTLGNLFSTPEFVQATSRATAARNALATRLNLFSEAMAELGLESGVSLQVDEERP